MKIVKASHTYMAHDCTPYQFIEKVGRTCYKSNDKITDDSSEKFVQNLINRNHWAMLEHETIYATVGMEIIDGLLAEIRHIGFEPRFLNVTRDPVRDIYVISGNFRTFWDLYCKFSRVSDICKGSTIRYVLEAVKKAYPLIYANVDIETTQLPSILWIHSRDEFIEKYKDYDDVIKHHLTHTVLFVCDRGVSHEIVRHRVASFGQESTRYCNYSKDKFGNEITVIEPLFYADEDREHIFYDTWKQACEFASQSYFKLLENGSTPQEARSVLPNSLKTEIIVTAVEEEWQHIVNLRYHGLTGSPHPQMVEVMTPVYSELCGVTHGRIS